MRLLMAGSPGSGKGTHGRRLGAHLGIPHIATGDLLREQVALGSEIGREAQAYMDRGDYVPDKVMIEMIRLRLAEPDAQNGFILDGFPRTLAQAEALDGALNRLGWSLHRVGSLSVPPDEVVRRLTGRRICGDCATPYHVVLNPPSKDDVCDVCGGILLRREDDHESVITARLEVYARDTAPLLDYYRGRGLLAEIDGRGKHDDVLRSLIAQLGVASRESPRPDART